MSFEFNFIFNYFAKLGKNRQNFINDGCDIPIPPNKKLIVTKDILVSDVHFFSNDNPNSIAQKSLRKNLSDIAAMGATPYGYLLGVSLPKNTDENFISDFCDGLHFIQELYNLELFGGDTNANRTNSIIISITMFGLSDLNSHLMPRNNGKINDSIYISGEIGNGYIGYLIRTNSPKVSNIKNKDFFLNHFLNGNCKNNLGEKISKLANSCIDISDGILQDLMHICLNSLLSAKIQSDKIPINPEVKNLIDQNKITPEELLRWGDDYELLFTGKKNNFTSLEKEIHEIGTLIKPKENPKIYLDDRIIENYKGFEH